MLGALILLGSVASTPLVIAHRGDSANFPEHTLAAYQSAMEAGADYIEPDLVITKDGHLIARHENELSDTTNVAAMLQFADRRRTKSIDGRTVTGWFAEDFTLAEIKLLRAKERIGAIRTESARYDGRFPVPTFKEVLELIAQHWKRRGVEVGVYPETKHPAYFQSINLPLEPPLVADLKAAGYTGASKVFIQSFEVANLKQLKATSDFPLVQLISDEGGPSGETVTYASMATPSGLAKIKEYAVGIGVAKALIFPRRNGAIDRPTNLIADAKAAGLQVHAWTFRPENVFLPRNLQNNPIAELQRFYAAGVDGVFADDPAVAIRARSAR